MVFNGRTVKILGFSDSPYQLALGQTMTWSLPVKQQSNLNSVIKIEHLRIDRGPDEDSRQKGGALASISYQRQHSHVPATGPLELIYDMTVLRREES
eukprot:scaffold62497_cov40-Prasinocladus_malaysianus.AAC.1